MMSQTHTTLQSSSPAAAAVKL